MDHFVLDSLIAPLWLGENILLGLAAWRLGQWLFPVDGWPASLVHALVLAWACIASSATALGLLGILDGFWLLATVASISGLMLLVDRRNRARLGQSSPEAPPAWDPPPRARWDGWAIAWLYVGCIWICRVAFSGLGGFPRDWDSLNYHIPMIDHWLNARSLYAPAEGNWATPGNNELIGLWMVAPFSGDFLIGLNNLPAASLLACTTLGLGAELGLSRAFQNTAALVVVCNVPVMSQLIDQRNDVAVGALFLGSLFYGLRYVRSCRFNDIAMAAVSLGLLSGIKYYALGYAAVAVAAIFGLAWLVLRPRVALGVAAVLVGGLLTWGGYWYARNYHVGGSPLYPLMAPATRAADDLPKVHANVWATSLYGHRSVKVLTLFAAKVQERLGPLHLASFTVLPVSIAWLVGSGLGFSCCAYARRERITRAMWGLLLVASGLVLAVTPFSVGNRPDKWGALLYGDSPTRYGLCFLSLAILASAIVLQDITTFLRSFIPEPCPPGLGTPGSSAGYSSYINCLKINNIIPIIILLSCIYNIVYFKYFSTSQKWELGLLHIVAVDLAILVTVIRIGWKQWLSTRKAFFLPFAVVAGSIACSAVGWLSHHWHAGFYEYYDRMYRTTVFTFLSKEVPSSARIAALCECSYPFFGSARQFDIVQPVPMQKYPTYPWLLRAAEERNIDFIVVRDTESKDYKYKQINDSLITESGPFTLVLQRGVFSLYRVDRAILRECNRGLASSPSLPDS